MAVGRLRRKMQDDLDAFFSWISLPLDIITLGYYTHACNVVNVTLEARISRAAKETAVFGKKQRKMESKKQTDDEKLSSCGIHYNPITKPTRKWHLSVPYTYLRFFWLTLIFNQERSSADMR